MALGHLNLEPGHINEFLFVGVVAFFDSFLLHPLGCFLFGTVSDLQLDDLLLG